MQPVTPSTKITKAVTWEQSEVLVKDLEVGNIVIDQIDTDKFDSWPVELIKEENYGKRRVYLKGQSFVWDGDASLPAVLRKIG